MNKNHFYMSYAGNKREECDKIFNFINFDGIDTIIEPFCGSCAMSCYINMKIPNLKYILNDNNKYLKEMYEIIIDEEKLINFENEYNNLLLDFNKNDYLEIIKKDDLMGWFIKNSNYTIRPGLFPIDKDKKKGLLIRNRPIYDFFKNSNIEFYNEDAIDIYKKYNNIMNCLILLDPPYLQLCNKFYLKTDTYIYEYLFNNNIKENKSKIYLILEDTWINKLLFKNCHCIDYNKIYQTSKKKTNHIIYTNQELLNNIH